MEKAKGSAPNETEFHTIVKEQTNMIVGLYAHGHFRFDYFRRFLSYVTSQK
jgi:hypothetical protein